VIDHIDRLRQALFWKGHCHVIGRQCLEGWDVLCSPRASGGLGICRVDFNVSLLSKRWPPFPWVQAVNHNFYQCRRPFGFAW